MNPESTMQNMQDMNGDIDERELLLDALVGGEAGVAAWQRWNELTAGEAAWWQRLAESQRDQAALQSLLLTAQEHADRAPLPIWAPQSTDALEPRALRLHSWLGWSGWAVAACVGVVLMLSLQFKPTSTGTPNVGSDAPKVATASMSAREAFNRYVALGQEEGLVVDELPERVLLSAQPNESGDGYELLYLRQVLERVSVPGMFQVEGQDERGNAGLVRYEQPSKLSI